MAAANEPSPPDPRRHFRVPTYGLLSLIIYYRLNRADNGIERFMDTQGFGVRFLFTTIGVFLKPYPAP